MTEPIKHFKEIKVSESDLDQLHHVNNTVYLKWVQDISEEHWRKQTSSEIQDQYLWMVLEHHIVYKKQARLGEVIKAVTYVSEMSGVRSNRQVDFYRYEELLVSCSSQWCMLDAETLRPKRVPDEVANLFRH